MVFGGLEKYKTIKWYKHFVTFMFSSPMILNLCITNLKYSFCFVEKYIDFFPLLFLYKMQMTNAYKQACVTHRQRVVIFI